MGLLYLYPDIIVSDLRCSEILRRAEWIPASRNTYSLTHSLTHSIQHSPSWEANRFAASQEISPCFIEPEGSLPHSQVLATCLYPEQDQSSPYPHIPHREDPSQYYPLIYALVSRVVSFPQVSPPKSYTRLPQTRYVPCPFFSILSPAQYCVRSTDHEAPYYEVFSTTLVPCPCYAQIFPSTPYSQTPSAYVFSSMSVTKFHTHTKQQVRL
jgi:hypothetical protein